jgi:Reverse transcriptase (RNA-dependent DNA polymerase)
LQIFEKIVANHLHEVMKKRWNPRQHGNRKDFSTESQLVCVHEEILTLVSKHGRVDCIRLDFTRAADMVVHSLLIEKLRELCIDPTLVRWIEAFLDSRLQSVKVRNAVSRPREVTSGLPQGSPLSNVLLMVYLNDLFKLQASEEKEQECQISQYCDDTLIFKSIGSKGDCTKLQVVIDKLQDWMYGKKMNVNMTKCFYLTFTQKCKTPVYEDVFQYKLKGKNIERQHTMKYLGMIMSDDFSLEPHYEYLQKKPAVLRLRDTTQALGRYPPVQRNFYINQVRRKLEKDCCVWNLPLSNDNRSLINKMERFQKSFLNDGMDKVQALTERRLYFTLELMFKILAKQKPYLSLMKSLDICENGFSYVDFEAYFKLEDSIIGNGLKELVRLRDFVELNDESVEFHAFVKQPKGGREKLMREFCADRFHVFNKVGEDGEPIKPSVALACITKCMHPNLSKTKLEKKMDDIFQQTTVNCYYINAILAGSVYDECSED